MKDRNISEDDIRIIDKRGRYSIPKWTIWTCAAVFLLVVGLLGARIVRQANFIRELTSSTTTTESVETLSPGRILITEINGRATDMKLSKWEVRSIYSLTGLAPRKVSANPERDIKNAWKTFKRQIANKQTTFEIYPIKVEVEYRNGKAWRYSFKSTLNGYSMTAVCDYDQLKALMDGMIE